MNDPLLSLRPLFPILSRTTYLVSNSLGAMPIGVAERLAEYVDQWAGMGVKAWANGWWEMPVTAGNEIAPLIGAAEGEVVMVPNVTMAASVVLSALDYAPPRDTVVMTELDFPSVRYVHEGLASRLGARIVAVPSDDGITVDTERLCAAIDERTRLVSISHVLFRSAYIVDVEAVCRRAREVGALVLLDAFHSVGIVPVDVKGLGVDFLVGGVLKWLCGGPGGCFLWANPDTTSHLAPALTGWQAHARPFDFAPSMEHAPGVERWLGGTPAIPALFAAIEGPRIVRRAGIEAIRTKSIRQTTRLLELADERGYPVFASRDPERRGGTVALDVPHAFGVARYLLSKDIFIDYRPGAGIRIAPHFYTSDAELERSIETIDEALEDDAWQAFAERVSVVT